MILDRLTDRQLVVLCRLCAGQTAEGIAQAEGIQVLTVRNVITAIRIRVPSGLDFPEICAVAAGEDPTIAATPAMGDGR